MRSEVSPRIQSSNANVHNSSKSLLKLSQVSISLIESVSRVIILEVWRASWGKKSADRDE